MCNAERSPRDPAERETEAESKHPEDASSAMQLQGVFLRDCPGKSASRPQMLSQILPTRVHFLNQRDFLLAPPAFYLSFAPFGLAYVAVLFIIEESMTSILLSKAIYGSGLMLADAPIEEACHSRVKRSGAASHDVNPERVVVTVSHGAKMLARCILKRIPGCSMEKDTSSGCFDCGLSRLAPSDSAQHWAGEGRKV
jgi:hypothetical protein